MSWNRVQLGSVLANNRDGTPKKKPTFWMPPGKPIFIPEGDQMHARPIVMMNAPDKDDTLALILYRNQLVGRFQGEEKVLIEME
jgi:hypothetical protein